MFDGKADYGEGKGNCFEPRKATANGAEWRGMNPTGTVNNNDEGPAGMTNDVRAAQAAPTAMQGSGTAEDAGDG